MKKGKILLTYLLTGVLLADIWQIPVLSSKATMAEEAIEESFEDNDVETAIQGESIDTDDSTDTGSTTTDIEDIVGTDNTEEESIPLKEADYQITDLKNTEGDILTQENESIIDNDERLLKDAESAENHEYLDDTTEDFTEKADKNSGESLDSDETIEVYRSGKCGDNLTWTLTYVKPWSYNYNKLTLTISGTGEMFDYSKEDKSPWREVSEHYPNVVIEEGVTSIGDYAFYSRDEIVQIEIPKGVRRIGKSAFRECENLKTVSVPKSVSEIGSYAFYRCLSLTEINIPEGVSKIEKMTFGVCKSLPSIILPDSITSIEAYAFTYCIKLSSTVIPPNVTSIGEGAFHQCWNMEKLVIPSNVTTIDDEAFWDCSGLKSITIGAGVLSIGKEAFAHEDSLESVVFLGNRPIVSQDAFSLVQTNGYYPVNDESWEGIQSYSFGGIINWGFIELIIELPEDQKVWLYTGGGIYPIPIVRNLDGNVLIEGEDYSLYYENNINPGTATITAIGLGDYAGQYASIDFEIKANIFAEEAKPVLRGYSANLSAIVTSETEINADDVEFVVENIAPSSIEYGTASIESIDESHYRVLKNVKIRQSGLYSFEASFNGDSDKAQIEVLDYETSAELGPRLKDETIASENQESITSYCDVRFVIKIKGINIENESEENRYVETLTDALDLVTYNDTEIEEVFRICSEKTKIGEDKTWGERIIRVVPIDYPETDAEFVFEEENGDTLQKNVKASYGITASLAYRSDKDKNDKSYSYNNHHVFSLLDDFFYKGACNYNNNLAVMTLGMAIAAFSDPSQDNGYSENLVLRSGNITDAYSVFNFEEDSIVCFKYDVALTNSDDSAAFSIATKYITSEESDDTLIAVVVRGGGYGGEWASNFHIGNSDDSQGFRESSDIIFQNIKNYLSRLNQQGKIVGKVKLWITGFSRGAAIANLVSHSVNQEGTISGVEILSDNNYTYSFATPSGHYGDGDSNTDNNIFNIISENDLVPRIPMKKWEFSRFGKNVILPTATPNSVKKRFNSITGLEFLANNEKNLEDLIVNGLVCIAPSRYDYCKYLQEYIVGWTRLVYQFQKGNWVYGVLLGASTALYKDVTLVTSKSLMDLPEKIELIFGRGFRTVGAIYDTVTETDFSKIHETDTVRDFTKVHYPEHYLAWLETGGLDSVAEKQYDYLSSLSDDERKQINSKVTEYIGSEFEDTNFTLVEVDKAYKISVLNPDEVLLASSVSGIAKSESDVSGVVSGEGVSIFYSADMNKALVLLDADNDYSVLFYPVGISNVTFSVEECDEESTRRTVVYSAVEVDDNGTVKLDIFGEGNTNDYEVTGADGNDLDPVYDSSSAEDTPHNVDIVGGYAAPEIASPGEVVHVYYDNTSDETFSSWISLNGDLSFGDSSAGETYFIMPDRNVYIEAETEDNALLYFGECGQSLYWVLNQKGQLRIIGNGDMTNYLQSGSGSGTSANAPWYQYASLIKNVVIGDGVTSIGQYAFYKCSELEEIVIPESITKIGRCAFSYCRKLPSVTIPEKVETISDYSFNNCSSLKEVILPAGIKYINERAFEYCIGLQSITIPGDSLAYIADLAFGGCTNLSDVYYGHSNADWYALGIGINDKKLFLENKTTIHCSDYCDITGNCGDNINWRLTSDGVLSITGSGAIPNFQSTNSPWVYLPISEIIIEEGITNIGTWSFRGCINLNTASLPNGLTQCGSFVFYDCAGLESIILPDGLKKINSYSFGGCTDLLSIVIPPSVTDISSSAFSSSAFCLGPENLTIYGVKGSYAEQFANDHNIEFSAIKYLSDISTSVTIDNQIYTGKELTPVPIVKVDGVKLTKDTDYTASYKNNIKTGTATVAITGIGHYLGTVSKSFMILPGKTTRGDMFNLANNVKVTWKEVPGAKYYKVYREGITDSKESQKEPVIVTGRLIGWDKQPGLTNGHAYRYRIVASLTGYDENGNVDPTGDSTLSYSKLMYRLRTVAIKSAKNTAPGKVTVTYNKTTSGDGYVLQWSEHEDMSNAKTKVVQGANTTSYVIGGLKKGKTYYISIRVRKKVGGIYYYTTFGVAKKIKITQ